MKKGLNSAKKDPNSFKVGQKLETNREDRGISGSRGKVAEKFDFIQFLYLVTASLSGVRVLTTEREADDKQLTVGHSSTVHHSCGIILFKITRNDVFRRT